MKLIAPRSADSMDGDSARVARFGDPSTGSAAIVAVSGASQPPTDALARPDPYDEVAPTGFVAGLPAHSVVRLDLRAALCRTTVSSARSRCVPLPRVASGRLGRFRVGCDLQIHRSDWVLLLSPSGEQCEHAPRDVKSSWRRGDRIATIDELTLRVAQFSVKSKT